ncbi:MbtH family protein [Mycobacterium colombiense]|uniref:MbtH family protein n=1 Tax=Mycobacterium colombiense TaxID=339268 RepID=UPI0011502B52|nr:MbtH family protein [Mycobacterium colombiense]
MSTGSFGAGERRPFGDGTPANLVVPANDKEQRRLWSVFADPASGLINRMPEANGVDEDACWPNVQQNEVKHR